jgi:hypothetical protein
MVSVMVVLLVFLVDGASRRAPLSFGVAAI